MENRQYISYSMDREFGCHTLYEIVSPVPSILEHFIILKVISQFVGSSITLLYYYIPVDSNAGIERRFSLCISGKIVDFTKSYYVFASMLKEPAFYEMSKGVSTIIFGNPDLNILSRFSRFSVVRFVQECTVKLRSYFKIRIFNLEYNISHHYLIIY